MGSPVSPVIANFSMEDFEQKALELSKHKPSSWFRYIGDTFVTSPHGSVKAVELLTQRKWTTHKLQFTVEKIISYS
jgi:retron-type reverse transcriptase